MASKTEVTPKIAGSNDMVLRAKLDRQWNASSTNRKEIDWHWFNYDLWVQGYHYAKWDKNTQQIMNSPRSDGKPKIVINKVYSTIRAIRNYVVRNEPKAEVTPENLTQENVKDATKLNKYLDYLYKRLGLRVKLRATVWHALKYSVGYWQVLWDEDGDDGRGQVQVNVIDPYDLYWDPSARTPNEARYCILAVRRNIDDLKEDPKYKNVDWDTVQTDRILAASPLKARLLQYERGSTDFNSSKDSSTVIVKEFWLKEKQKDGSTKVRIIATINQTQVVLRNELTDIDRLPFFRLMSDVEPLQMYGQGWVKNLVPLNKLLERLHSSLAEYNDIMNKGKWVADKGAGVRIIDNQNGQIIEKKRGFDVHQEPISPLSAAIFEQINFVTTMFEDISSFHDASLGRIPTGAKSGVSIEALQEGDSNNLAELVENTEVFLEDAYEYLLALASEKYQFARNIVLVNNTGVKEFMSVIGEAAANVPQDAMQIPGKNIVDVKITSWLAYTSEGRREAIKDLVSIMPNLDPETILQAYEIGPIADIIERMEEHQQEQQQQQQQMQAQQMQQQGQMQMQQQAHQSNLKQQEALTQSMASQPQMAGQAQAIAVIRQVINGHIPQQLPQQVGQDYINYFDKFLSSPEAKSLPHDLHVILQQIRDHAAATMQGGAIPNPQTAPQQVVQ